MNGAVLGIPRVLVRTENLAIMAAAVAAYGWLDANWLFFAFLFLVPDIFMIGYPCKWIKRRPARNEKGPSADL